MRNAMHRWEVRAEEKVSRSEEYLRFHRVPTKVGRPVGVLTYGIIVHSCSLCSLCPPVESLRAFP
jgi:tetrahydromethanopterin S-methyltransferase subunit G